MAPNTHRFLLSFPLKHREEADPEGRHVQPDQEALYALLHDRVATKTQTRLLPFNAQNFKIGSLDALVLVGEDLAKIDQTFEAIIDRLHGHLRNLAAVHPDEPGVEGPVLIDELEPEQFLSEFHWSAIKYRTDLSVKELADTLAGEIAQMDSLVKAKVNAFNLGKAEIDAINKGKTGSLAVRDLDDLIAPADVVASEFMETLAVIVPRHLKAPWLAGYEALATMVVPGSSKLILEDADNCLFTVTLFKKFKPEFKANCSAKQYTVRECAARGAAEGEGAASPKANLHQLQLALHAQWSSLVKLVRSNLGDAHASYLHLKALRLFVESVLRYGLPAHYLSLYAHAPDDKHLKSFSKKLLSTLEALKLPGISLVELATALHSAGHEEAGTIADAAEQELWTALNMSSRDYEPYVKLPLKLRL